MAEVAEAALVQFLGLLPEPAFLEAMGVTAIPAH